MANIFQIKRRTSGAAGAPAALANGELAFNEVNNSLYYGKLSSTPAIGGTGDFTTVDTSQTLSGSKTFSSSVVLSSAVAETKATATSAASVATTEFVQNVFSLLDGGDFDDVGGGGNNGGGNNGGRLNVPNDVTIVFSPQAAVPVGSEAWADLTSWFDVSGQPISALPTNTDVVFISGGNIDGYNPLVIDPHQYSLGIKMYVPDYPYCISLSASSPVSIPLSMFVDGDGVLRVEQNVELI